MSFISTQNLDAVYNDLTVTDSTNINELDTITVQNQATFNGTSTFNGGVEMQSTVTIAGVTNIDSDLMVTGEIQVDGTTTINNKSLYCGANANGVFPNLVSNTITGCITGDLAHNSELDFVNIASTVTDPTFEAFNFYKLPNLVPIVSIQNQGVIQCNGVFTNGAQPLLANQIGYMMNSALQTYLTLTSSINTSTIANIDQSVINTNSLLVGTYMCTGNIQLLLSQHCQLNSWEYLLVDDANGDGLVSMATIFGSNPANTGNFTTVVNIPINCTFYNVADGGIILELNLAFETTLQGTASTITIEPLQTFMNFVRIA